MTLSNLSYSTNLLMRRHCFGLYVSSYLRWFVCRLYFELPFVDLIADCWCLPTHGSYRERATGDCPGLCQEMPKWGTSFPSLVKLMHSSEAWVVFFFINPNVFISNMFRTWWLFLRVLCFFEHLCKFNLAFLSHKVLIFKHYRL